MSNAVDHDDAPKRPLFLGVALVVMCVVGLHTLSEGWAIMEIVTDPFAAGRLVDHDLAPAATAANQAFVDALRGRSDVLLPVGIAQLLLGGALVLVAAGALLGRRGSTGFALQVIVANLALLGVAYVLREPVRIAVVDAWVTTTGDAAGADPSSMTRSQGLWIFRLKLAAEVGALVLSAFALTRRSVRAALAPPEPSTDEEF